MHFLIKIWYRPQHQSKALFQCCIIEIILKRLKAHKYKGLKGPKQALLPKMYGFTSEGTLKSTTTSGRKSLQGVSPKGSSKAVRENQQDNFMHESDRPLKKVYYSNVQHDCDRMSRLLRGKENFQIPMDETVVPYSTSNRSPLENCQSSQQNYLVWGFKGFIQKRHIYKASEIQETSK